MRTVGIKGTAYCLNHCAELAFLYGNTPYMERKAHGETEFLLNLPNHIQSYDEACRYAPNLVYIGAMEPENLRQTKVPFSENLEKDTVRFGSFGEIMPEDEFIALMSICDVFDLIWLEENFRSEVKVKIDAHAFLDEFQKQRLGKGYSLSEIENEIKEHHALPLYYGNKIAACVRTAHDTDENLFAHVMLENLACKASGVLSLLHLIKNSGMNPADIDYVIECSEEAVGDMNQRGGGNMAKAVAEIANCTNATGCDVRGFCAGPTSALINAAGLIYAGVHKNIAVVAGGSIPKLYMNAREHVKKNMKALENCIGSFGVLLAEDDGTMPVIRLDSVGKHSVGDGASPQAVATALILKPLEKLGLKIIDVDKYAPELHTPEITVPAGAGDVPEANYKMISALAVMKGQVERSQMNAFIEKIGMIGFAPTQGHIPSGVPFIGHAVKKIQQGLMQRVMIIGKGSLFLGRITNLMDGASFLIEKNTGFQNTEANISQNDINHALLEAITQMADTLINDENPDIKK